MEKDKKELRDWNKRLDDLLFWLLEEIRWQDEKSEGGKENEIKR